MREPSPGASRWPWLIVAAAVLFGAVGLYPDFCIPGPESNDRVLHAAVANYVADHAAAHWTVDPWYPSIATGFPLFAHYQHLPHLIAVTLARLMPFDVEAGRVLLALCYVILSVMPVVIYASMRRLGLDAAVAAAAAGLYPVLKAVPFFGIGWESYLHAGSGLLPQLWGVLFVFPALAWGYDALRSGRIWGAGVLLGACALSHGIYAYMAALSLGLLVVIPDPGVPWTRRLARLAGIGGVALAVSAYFVIPLVAYSGEVLRSQWEPSWKWDSIGWSGVLDNLIRGRVFDGTGWPLPLAGPERSATIAPLSVLVAAGLLWTARRALRNRDRLDVWLVSGFVVWVALFAGRAGWGPVVDVLPLSSGLHMHRFIAGVQIFGLPLAAIALCAALRASFGRSRALGIGATVVVVLGAAAAYGLRANDMRQDDRIAAERRTAVERDERLPELIDYLRTLPPGRVYAGMYYDWGRQFTVGGIPMYTVLQSSGFDMVGYLFMAMAIPGEWQVRLDYRELASHQLYGSRWLVAPASVTPPAFAVPLRTIGPYAVYEIPGSGYFAVGAVDPSPEAAEAEDWPALYRVGREWARELRPGARRFLAMGGAVDPLSDADGGRVLDERVEPGRFACRVVAPGVRDVVLKATYHPFWRASVDGQPSRIVRVFPGFMAVRVPGGEHLVELVYRPPWWKRVLFALSVAATLAALAVPLAGARRRRRERRASKPG